MTSGTLKVRKKRPFLTMLAVAALTAVLASVGVAVAIVGLSNHGIIPADTVTTTKVQAVTQPAPPAVTVTDTVTNTVQALQSVVINKAGIDPACENVPPGTAAAKKPSGFTARLPGLPVLMHYDNGAVEIAVPPTQSVVVSAYTRKNHTFQLWGDSINWMVFRVGYPYCPYNFDQPGKPGAFTAYQYGPGQTYDPKTLGTATQINSPNG